MPITKCKPVRTLRGGEVNAIDMNKRKKYIKIKKSQWKIF